MLVYQLFRCCGPVGHRSQTFAQSMTHSWIHSVIKSGSQSSSQIHWFIHAFSPSVSQRPNQPANWNSVDTEADGWTQPGSRPTWSCWLPADLLMFLSSPGPEPSLIQPGQLKYLTLSLSFSVWVTTKRSRFGRLAQVQFTKTVCAPHVVFVSRFYGFLVGFYWSVPSSC